MTHAPFFVAPAKTIAARIGSSAFAAPIACAVPTRLRLIYRQKNRFIRVSSSHESARRFERLMGMPPKLAADDF